MFFLLQERWKIFLENAFPPSNPWGDIIQLTSSQMHILLTEPSSLFFFYYYFFFNPCSLLSPSYKENCEVAAERKINRRGRAR